MPKASPQTLPQANRHSDDAGALLLVEDHQGYREVMRTALACYLPGFEVVEAESIATALTALETRRFDVMVTDMTLPDGSGIDLVDQAGRFIHDGMRVILTSSHDSREMRPALDRGDVHGYVAKENGVKALAQAVRDVTGGRHTS
ncbi:MAG: response regulator [Prosthecobacter sp.]|nr:response regulator [Prosthecobacter sp.]